MRDDNGSRGGRREADGAVRVVRRRAGARLAEDEGAAVRCRCCRFRTSPPRPSRCSPQAASSRRGRVGRDRGCIGGRAAAPPLVRVGDRCRARPRAGARRRPRPCLAACRRWSAGTCSRPAEAVAEVAAVTAVLEPTARVHAAPSTRTNALQPCANSLPLGRRRSHPTSLSLRRTAPWLNRCDSGGDRASLAEPDHALAAVAATPSRLRAGLSVNALNSSRLRARGVWRGSFSRACTET